MAKPATKTHGPIRARVKKEPPLDDEPLSPADLRAIDEGRKAFARGDYVSLEELEEHVASLRRRSRKEGSRTDR